MHKKDDAYTDRRHAYKLPFNAFWLSHVHIYKHYSNKSHSMNNTPNLKNFISLNIFVVGLNSSTSCLEILSC